MDQISKTIGVFGTIDEQWPEVMALPDYGKILFEICPRISLKECLPAVAPVAIDFLEGILRFWTMIFIRFVRFLHGPGTIQNKDGQQLNVCNIRFSTMYQNDGI